ncbi:hypothetical protein PILCRDRAFT_817093 [Piloderma croceum F 1598]|uniref:Uncharacterized protein n=1 Tax=Piloderma croceum (strain F 1598) TaxID=765440 RepID=A0A0C3C832_PILCF|nr:hypothetical protein PILCRDRAFT_817093 [Piloderma croceum F 1598]
MTRYADDHCLPKLCGGEGVKVIVHVPRAAALSSFTLPPNSTQHMHAFRMSDKLTCVDGSLCAFHLTQ